MLPETKIFYNTEKQQMVSIEKIKLLFDVDLRKIQKLIQANAFESCNICELVGKQSHFLTSNKPCRETHAVNVCSRCCLSGHFRNGMTETILVNFEHTYV